MATRSVNKVILLGHLGKDAETKFTPGGTAKSTFSLATTRNWKDQASGEWKTETDWHNVVLWRGENLANYLLKGKQIYVEGRLQTRSWEDKDGQKKYMTEIVADSVILCGGGGEGGGDREPRERQSSGNGRASSESAARPGKISGSDDFGGMGITDDDVPFSQLSAGYPGLLKAVVFSGVRNLVFPMAFHVVAAA